MNGKLRRMYGLIMQEIFISKHSLEILFDIVIFPLINVLLFGLINRYVSSIGHSTNADYLLIGVLLWEILVINQYSISMPALFNIWTHNLSNIFIAPISWVEYIIADIMTAIIKTIFIFAFLALSIYLIFSFNIAHMGVINLVLAFVNLSIFGWSLGIFILGYIFRFGTRIQAAAWGLIFLFQPLTASFFPVSVLPPFLQHVAYALPPTLVFQAARHSFIYPGIEWHAALVSFGLNIIYATIAVIIFVRLFHKSKVTGQFARNDL